MRDHSKHFRTLRKDEDEKFAKNQKILEEAGHYEYKYGRLSTAQKLKIEQAQQENRDIIIKHSEQNEPFSKKTI